MIRMVLTLNDRTIIVLGLEPANLKRIAEGEPIAVNLRDIDPDGPPMDLPDIDLFVGATDTDDWRAFMAKLGRQ